MKYPFVFYAEFGVPEGAAGCARGPLVFIRPSHRDDRGILAHELCHVKQAFIGLFVAHALFYALVPKYRLWSEVEAYREQAKHYDDDRIPRFAKFIAEKYRLKISAEEAERLLRA